MFAASLLLQSFVLLGSLRHRFRVLEGKFTTLDYDHIGQLMFWELHSECLDPFDVPECEAFDIFVNESLCAGKVKMVLQQGLHMQRLKVKESEAFRAVASNTGGATTKDLFEDVAEELETNYHYDKTRVKDAMKTKKLVFEDLLKRAKEKEKKEQKRRRRFAKDFRELLDNIKVFGI
ncbi:hypothetical protein LXL04_011787 [Taraxacum kok-saghyz]